MREQVERLHALPLGRGIAEQARGGQGLPEPLGQLRDVHGSLSAFAGAIPYRRMPAESGTDITDHRRARHCSAGHQCTAHAEASDDRVEHHLTRESI